MLLRLSALAAVIVLAMIGSQTAFAETPTPISILIEEKITVGDGSTPSGEVINESIGVTDEVITSGEVITESITVTDTVETQLSALPTATATAVPKKVNKRPTAVPAKRKSAVRATPTPPRRDSRNPFSRGTGSVNEEEPVESGSCNSVSGYEGLALMSVLLIPGVLKYRRRKE